MRHGRWVVGLTLLALGIACVTINVYFPEGEIKDLSQVIEDEVRRQAALREAGVEPESPPPARGDSGSSSSLFDVLLGVTPAYAQAVSEPEVTSPAIRVIIGSRAERLAQVDAFKSQGVIGENNKGLLEVRNLKEVSDLKVRADLTKLVRDENSDRERLYKEIAVTKGVDAAQIPRIAQTYAETLRAGSRPGDWIQLPDGSWKQK